MAAKTLDMMVVLNGTIGNGIGEIGNKLTAMGAAVDVLSGKLFNFGKEGVEVYADYQQNMLDAEGALSSQYESTAELNIVMGKLDESAQQWAATTRFHTDDVSQAISEAAHAGWTYERMMAGIPQAMLIAQAGNMELSDSLDYLIKATNALNVPAENMGTFIDQWAMSANSSATNIEELGQAMLRMGSTMQFTDSTAELFTMLGVLANMGTVGSDAGTLLRNSMLRVIAPTDKAKEAMKALGDVSEEEYAELEASSELLGKSNEILEKNGFSAYDATGKLKPMLQLFNELNDVTADMSEEDRNTVLSAIFPTRTITGALNLLRAASESWGGLYEKIQESDGYAQQVSDIQMSGLTGTLAIFESKVEELKRAVGEALAPDVEWGATFIGQFVDFLNGIDDTTFSALVNGLESVAAAGGALLGVGAALRIIGYLLTPQGIVVGGLVAVAGALKAVAEYKDLTFDENFGEMALDLNQLSASIAGLSTSTEDKLEPLQQYVDKLNTLGDEYQTATAKFSSEVTMAALTGDKLDSKQIKNLKQLGSDIYTNVQTGIQQAKDLSLGTLNAVFPDDMDAEEYLQYSSLYDLIGGYYGSLEEQAAELGGKITEALNTALEDGYISMDEQKMIDGYIQKLNEIEAAIMQRQNAQEYSRMLEKGQHVSKETIGDYMELLEESSETRKDNENNLIYDMMADAKKGLEKDLGRELTDEEWHNRPEYKTLEERRLAANREVDVQYGQLAENAFETLLSGAGVYDSLLKAQEITANLPKDVNGRPDFSGVDITQSFGSAEELQKFYDDLEILHSKGGIAGIFGLGENELAEMIAPWADTPGLKDLYETVTKGTDGLYDYFNENLDKNRQFDYAPGSVLPYIMDNILGHGYGASDFQQWYGTVQQSKIVTIQPPMPNVNPVLDLQQQGVQVDVSGDTTELQATIDGADGQTLMEYVSGDATNLSLTIKDQDGNILVENVTGNAAALASAIEAYNGKTVTVNIRGNNLLGNSLSGYATGGRADTASIFGEAGPEWAIPEEHSANTAALLDAARAASGFTWPELIERNGGMNAGGGSDNRTLVYSPIIYANDATGVEEKLKEDKARLDKWWEEKKLRDSVEVFR